LRSGDERRISPSTAPSSPDGLSAELSPLFLSPEDEDGFLLPQTVHRSHGNVVSVGERQADSPRGKTVPDRPKEILNPLFPAKILGILAEDGGNG
jgi:hypothetical protein